MRRSTSDRYTRLTHILALILSLAIGCGPLSLSGSRHHDGGSRLAADDDDGDDPDESTMIDELSNQDLGRSETQLAITTDPSIDGVPYIDPGYPGSCDAAMCLVITQDPALDHGDGNGHNGDSGSATPPVGTATAATDDDAWIKKDDLSSRIWEIKRDSKRFLEDHGGDKDAGDHERAKSPVLVVNAPNSAQITPVDYPYKTPVQSVEGQRLAQAWQYAKAVRSGLNPSDQLAVQNLQMVDAADNSFHKADTAFSIVDRGTAEFAMQLGQQILDAVAVGPSSAWSKTTMIAITGIDPSTASRTSSFMQGSAMVATATLAEGMVAASVAEVLIPIVTAVAIVVAIAKISDSLNDETKKDSDLVVAEILDESDPSTPVGYRGEDHKVAPGTNSPSTIGGREYSGHALDRMQERGLRPSIVEDAIQNGRQQPGKREGTIEYTGENGGKVVTTTDGKVITVW